MDAADDGRLALSNARQRPKLGFRPDIEGLRAVAVLAVVAYHYGIAGVAGGFVGVDVFFVISGYLISGILLGELAETGRLDLLRFYGRRARRLLPASLLVMLVTLVVGTVLLAPPEQEVTGRAAGTSALYISNIWLMTRLADYFAPESAGNPFLHTWSLAVEEQLYAVWPLLLLLGHRFARRHLPWVIAAVTLLSFALCVRLSVWREPWAFYLSPTRAWEFGFGALAVLPPVTRWARGSRFAVALGWLGAVALAASMIWFSGALRFPGWIALLPVAGTAALLVGGEGDAGWGPHRVLALRPLTWLGGLSYSIYLWHWPIIVFATVLDPARGPATVAACCALTLACAWLSFRLLEHPVRVSTFLTRVRWRSAALGAALTACGVLLGGGDVVLARQFEKLPMQSRLSAWIWQPPVASGSGHGCMRDFTEGNTVPCVFGDAAAPRSVVLFGDSHADQWSTAFAEVAARRDWKLVTFLKSACPASDVPTYNNRLHRELPECAAFRDQAIADIVLLHPALIVVTQFSSGYIKDWRPDIGDHGVSYNTWAAGLRNVLTRLRASGAPVVLLRDSPTPYVYTADCVARALWRHGSPQACATPRGSALDQHLFDLERNVAAAVGGVGIVDMSGQFCNAQTCPAFQDEMMVYRDGTHLTTQFVASLAGPLGKAIVLR